MGRPLGNVQESVLDSLKRHGSFHPWCGWVWDNYGGTVRVLDSLVRRGLVETSVNSRGHTVYKPTEVDDA